jgi:hypothetical protein
MDDRENAGIRQGDKPVTEQRLKRTGDMPITFYGEEIGKQSIEFKGRYWELRLYSCLRNNEEDGFVFGVHFTSDFDKFEPDAFFAEAADDIEEVVEIIRDYDPEEDMSVPPFWPKDRRHIILEGVNRNWNSAITEIFDVLGEIAK